MGSLLIDIDGSAVWGLPQDAGSELSRMALRGDDPKCRPFIALFKLNQLFIKTGQFEMDCGGNAGSSGGSTALNQRAISEIFAFVG
jgi:hypothetical protein